MLMMLAKRMGPPTDDDEQWLTIREVCERMRVCENTLRKMIGKGEFPPATHRLNGKPRWTWRVVRAAMRSFESRE